MLVLGLDYMTKQDQLERPWNKILSHGLIKDWLVNQTPLFALCLAPESWVEKKEKKEYSSSRTKCFMS